MIRLPPISTRSVTLLPFTTSFRSMMGSEGDDDFFTWPVTSEKQLYPVLYREPQNPVNHSAIGFNAYSDSARRAAMVRAFDAGAPRATAPTVLQIGRAHA